MRHACEISLGNPSRIQAHRGEVIRPSDWVAEAASSKPLKAKQKRAKMCPNRSAKGSVRHACETGNPQQDSSPQGCDDAVFGFVFGLNIQALPSVLPARLPLELQARGRRISTYINVQEMIIYTLYCSC